MAKRKTRNPDHVRRKNVPGSDNEAIEAQLTDLVSPAVANQLAYYRQLGLRSRILNLALMVAAVLTMLWRQVPSVHELTRMLYSLRERIFKMTGRTRHKRENFVNSQAAKSSR
jgi:hypothetical protein